MNLFKKGDIVKIGLDYVGTYPKVANKFGRISFIRNNEICSVVFKNNDPYIWNFHYTKLSNPILIRNRKIEIILNET